MKVYELTTGFIAAVMIALGAAYYVNNSPTVGGEPEEVSMKLAALNQDCVWYQYIGENYNHPNYGLEIEDFEKYLYFEEDPDVGPDCPGGVEICAVCLPFTGDDNPDELEFLNIIDEIRAGSTASGVVMLKPAP